MVLIDHIPRYEDENQTPLLGVENEWAEEGRSIRTVSLEEETALLWARTSLDNIGRRAVLTGVQTTLI